MLFCIPLFAALLLIVPDLAAAEPPSSARSRAAEAKVENRLTTELSKQGLKIGAPIFIRILKEPAVLELWIKKDQPNQSYERFRRYDICKYSGALGPKLKEGDGQAPEGIYLVASAQMNPNSRFHLSFNLGYPNEFDRAQARTGSALMVHGDCVSIGCYAMGDDAIEEIWTLSARAFRAGQKSIPFHIFPFPLTEAKLKREEKSQWITFWRDLKPIFDQFEKSRTPPSVKVTNARYELE